MRKKCMTLVLAALAALTFVSCGDTYIGGDTITNNNGPSGPTASPSPGTAGAGCPVAGVIGSVRVNPFGYQCPAGTPIPNNSSGVLPVGCTAIVTATPKDAVGRDVPDNVHGPNIVWALELGADKVDVNDFTGQPFNKNVVGTNAGEFRLAATVCSVTGAWNGRVIP